MQFLRSLLFNVLMYLWMLVVAVPLPALLKPRWSWAVCQAYCRGVLWMLRTIVGLRVETRGTVPEGQVLVAAKHQSFLDVFAIFVALPRAFFIMKDILKWTPFVGWYALRMGTLTVKRGRRSEAVKTMVAKVRDGTRDPGQLVIYPQGTRTAPGAHLPYKAGTFALYEQLGQPCVPVAGNVGLFWPKRGITRKPGTAVIEFLEPIPPGLDRDTFMAELERRIEEGSNRLMAEAGFDVASTEAGRRVAAA